SVVGADPFAILIARGDRISLWREGRERCSRGNPFHAVRALLDAWKVQNPDGLPFPGAAIGAFGYDLGQHLERLPHRAEDDLEFPDLVLGLYDALSVFDHHESRAFRVETSPGSPARAIDPSSYDAHFRTATPSARRGGNFTRER